MKIEFWWRQIFEILMIHKPSLGSPDVPQKIWARSVQPFWRLLDTNRQTSQICIWIKMFNSFKYLLQYLKKMWKINQNWSNSYVFNLLFINNWTLDINMRICFLPTNKSQTSSFWFSEGRSTTLTALWIRNLYSQFVKLWYGNRLEGS